MSSMKKLIVSIYVCSGFGWGIGLCIASRLMGPRTVRVVAEVQPAAETSPVDDVCCHLHKQALDDISMSLHSDFNFPPESIL
jgi:hypothetical protein